MSVPTYPTFSANCDYPEFNGGKKVIEQLTARVREIEEENARLKAECDDIKQVQFPRKLEAVAVDWKKQLMKDAS